MTWQSIARTATHPRLRAGLPPALPSPPAGPGHLALGRVCLGVGQAGPPARPGHGGVRERGWEGSENKMQEAERPRQVSLISARPRQRPVPARHSPSSHRRQPPASRSAAGVLAAAAPRVPRPLPLSPAPCRAGVSPPGQAARQPCPSPLSLARCGGSAAPSISASTRHGTGKPSAAGPASLAASAPRRAAPRRCSRASPSGETPEEPLGTRSEREQEAAAPLRAELPRGCLWVFPGLVWGLCWLSVFRGVLLFYLLSK